MPAAKVTQAKFIEICQRLGSAQQIANEIGVDVRNVYRRARALESNLGLTLLRSGAAADKAEPTTTDADKLRAQIRTLKAEVNARTQDNLSDEYVRSQIIKLTKLPIDVPKWTNSKPKKSTGVTGVPTLMASDWHWGETVFPKQVNGVNEYNIEIAHRRAFRFFDTAIKLLTQHMVNPEYPGIVFILGGDMLSGDIHEELQDTNDIPVLPALLDLHGILIAGIEKLADQFGRVFLPCVTGNHGRNTRKMRAKHRNFTNFDWLLYNMLAKHFEDDSRITFLIPDGSDANYTVYGHRYCLTHGDQFRGGDSMIGALGPITRGDHKKRSRNTQIDMSYDTLVMGHWHQLIQLNKIIVNGSLKGYDEYAYMSNFGFEPPQQALWIDHPKHGVTFRMGINVDDSQIGQINKEWVSWKD